MTEQRAKFEDSKTLRDFMPGAASRDGTTFRAGKPLPPGSEVASWDRVVEALQTVHDPEIPINIYDLGLIYRLDIAENGNVGIEMTLTAPACPVAGSLPGQVADAAAAVPGVGVVVVNLVWDPPWTPDRMSEDARMVLDIP